jgi:hypothetical protein
MSEPSSSPSALAEALMQMSEMILPMREWLAGQVSYFAGQGFKPEEALAMAAATYVTVFGSAIPRELPEGWGQ